MYGKFIYSYMVNKNKSAKMVQNTALADVKLKRK